MVALQLNDNSNVSGADFHVFCDSRRALIVLAMILGGCAEKPGPQAAPGAGVDRTAPAAVTVDPDNWPTQAPVMVRDDAMEERIAELLSRMTLEEKVGQVIQADINQVTPEEVRDYNLGSILNGGGSAPDGDNRTTPDKWLELADAFWDASTDTGDGGVGIPTIWGTDAVHGHSNVLGATLFPHNIGLGMANDPDMMYDIGRVTALEILATGLDWTFAPTVAVARNDRWGRTYESYSEDPRIVAAYAPRIVEGLQGRYGTDRFLDEDHLIATAKHFVGDGGTTEGIDQGDTAIPEAELREIHAVGYPPAIAAGVQTVMASFNSYHGRKMHGNPLMLTDVLVHRMGFDGFVVGDWNGHGQVRGCSKESCPESMNAGLDMFMAPNSWKALYANTLRQTNEGVIPIERLDEAVARILRVKMRLGLLDAGRPSERKHAGNFELLGAPAHRAIARDAVRKSLVLLKNNGSVLPIQAGARVLVTGDGAHNVGKQSGGWTLNWQGDGNLREHFPNAASIYEGLRDALAAGGGEAVLSEDGSFTERPDIAIVVFGEDPYAEGVGDRPHVDFVPVDSLDLLRQFREAGIPTVGVFLSGRPMWVNPEINASDAFVAAWLPGSEGGGIADVLVAGADGLPRYDFTGRLSFSWPKSAVDVALNVGDPDYDPLFAYGFGLSYGDENSLGRLSEESGLVAEDAAEVGLIRYGDPVGALQVVLRDDAGETVAEDTPTQSAGGHLVSAPADRNLQHDTKLLTWRGPAEVVVAGSVAGSDAALGAALAVQLEYQILATGEGPVTLAVGSESIDWSERVKGAENAGWRTEQIPLRCFEYPVANIAALDPLLAVGADSGLVLQIESASFVRDPGGYICD
jgi:beta-glucosidase